MKIFRSFFFVLITLSGTAFACGEPEKLDTLSYRPSFLGWLLPYIDRHDLEGRTVGYLRWESTYQDILKFEEGKMSASLSLKEKEREPIFGSFASAKSASKPQTRLILTIDTDQESETYGDILSLYDMNTGKTQEMIFVTAHHVDDDEAFEDKCVELDLE